MNEKIAFQHKAIKTICAVSFWVYVHLKIIFRWRDAVQSSKTGFFIRQGLSIIHTHVFLSSNFIAALALLPPPPAAEVVRGDVAEVVVVVAGGRAAHAPLQEAAEDLAAAGAAEAQGAHALRPRGRKGRRRFAARLAHGGQIAGGGHEGVLVDLRCRPRLVGNIWLVVVGVVVVVQALGLRYKCAGSRTNFTISDRKLIFGKSVLSGTVRRLSKKNGKSADC